VTLLSGWALGGLVLLAPLVIVHLRREQRPVHDVPSLLLWEALEEQASPQPWRPRLRRLPLLLVLQALALVVLVVALARPAVSGTARAAAHIYVLDDSLWMGAPGRLEAAEARTERLAGALPRRAPVLVVLADGAPHVIYRGAAAGVSAALRRIAPGAAPSSLTQAMSLAAGLLGSARDRVVLLRAPEDAFPPVRAAPAGLRTMVVGAPVADQGILSPQARCGVAVAGGCEVLAVVANSAAASVVDRYTVYADGAAAGSGLVRVGARSSADVVLPAYPGERMRVRLDVRDVLTIDDQAWILVPGPTGAPPSTTVTLVGAPNDALAVARAFAAVPGVTLRLRTGASYRPADARAAELTVLDRWLPPGDLPPSPAVVLIDPPRLPGGRVGGQLGDSTPSGEDAASGLVSGVDLTSLAIDTGAARRLSLPRYLMPAVWSPDGALLAAGDDGSRRLAVLSFDPAQSDLPQLESFPILASNLVRWGAGWAPSSAWAGEPLSVDASPGARVVTLTLDGTMVARQRLRGTIVELPVGRPGLYAVTETGPGVTRRATVAVSVAAQPAAHAAAPVDLTVARAPSAAGHGPLRAPWLLAAAMVLVVLEWTCWRSRPAQPQAAAG
jgi:Ca-activated chloride channel homolog